MSTSIEMDVKNPEFDTYIELGLTVLSRTVSKGVADGEIEVTRAQAVPSQEYALEH
jgi:hypothetical protein